MSTEESKFEEIAGEAKSILGCGLQTIAIWIGVIITIMIEIGQVTPPVGLNLSVLAALTNNEVNLGRVAIATIPYWMILLLSVVILTLFPAIALFLPDLAL